MVTFHVRIILNDIETKKKEEYSRRNMRIKTHDRWKKADATHKLHVSVKNAKISL